MDGAYSFLGMNVYPFGLFVAAGTLLTLGLMGVLGYTRRLPAGTVRVFGLLGIPLGLLGSRTAYCLFNLSSFTETYGNPWLMLNFFDGGLSLWGLLCGLVLAAFLTALLMKARFAHVLDAFATSVGLLLTAVYLGEGYTELGIGKVVQENVLTTHAPWLFLREQMGVNVEYRMAVYRYQALACAILLIVMLTLFLRFRGRKALRPGDLSMVFFSLFGGVQIVLESLRDDGHMLITFLRLGQVGAAVLILIACGVFSRRYLHLKAKKDHRILWTWLIIIVCVAGVALLEFSLDGRFSWGVPSMGRDYALMAVLCCLMAALPCSLCHTLNKKLYHEERFQVKIAVGEEGKR
ncbi:MAG: prolipoprotein diacylglyceryl transferase [Eubacteriales bacterium]|nr:prolipoprotein diacylglyceryl transferase [Eubacteriales bacterium]